MAITPTNHTRIQYEIDLAVLNTTSRESGSVGLVLRGGQFTLNRGGSNDFEGYYVGINVYGYLVMGVANGSFMLFEWYYLGRTSTSRSFIICVFWQTGNISMHSWIMELWPIQVCLMGDTPLAGLDCALTALWACLITWRYQRLGRRILCHRWLEQNLISSGMVFVKGGL